jgi:hypothetical protein
LFQIEHSPLSTNHRNIMKNVLPKESIPRLFCAPPQRATTKLAALTLLTATLLTAQANAIMIDIPNADFETASNDGTAAGGSYTVPIVGGLLGNYDQIVGSGPWYASGNGIADVISSPTTTIGGGDATVSSVVSTSVLGLGILTTSSSVYQDSFETFTGSGVNATFTEGMTYILTAEIHTPTLLSLDLLTDSGVGIRLKAGGTSTSLAGTTPVVLDIDLFDNTTGTLTYTIVADSSMDGKNIGVDLYTGEFSGAIGVNALGAVSFDNVTLSAVPEPASVALMTGLFGVLYTLKRRRRNA